MSVVFSRKRSSFPSNNFLYIPFLFPYAKKDIKNQSEGFIMLFKPVIALVLPVRSTWE